jgi:deoxycytidylate deaminase
VTPPHEAIDRAREAAMQSPCAKSQRGAIVFAEVPCGMTTSPIILGSGFNGPPGYIRCTGSETCRKFCGQRCMHAESRALHNAGQRWMSTGLHAPWHMLHVKVENGAVVPSGPPSCWQCSRDILDAGIHTMWLLEGPPQGNCRWGNELAVWCGYCNGDHCRQHPAHYKTNGTCGCSIEKRHSGLLLSGHWVAYTAEAFHAETLKNCGIAEP